jgi:hypothetical protein
LNIARAIHTEDLENHLNVYKVKNNIQVFKINNKLSYYLARLLKRYIIFIFRIYALQRKIGDILNYFYKYPLIGDKLNYF